MATVVARNNNFFHKSFEENKKKVFWYAYEGSKSDLPLFSYGVW